MPVLPDPAAAAPPAAPSVPAPAVGLGTSALVLGVLGTLAVAVAVALSIGAPPGLVGLALASGGLVLAAGGLVLGTVAAVRGGVRGNRTAISAAGLSVVGLSGALIWLAAFVITMLSGALPAAPGGSDGAAPPTCAAP